MSNRRRRTNHLESERERLGSVAERLRGGDDESAKERAPTAAAAGSSPRRGDAKRADMSRSLTRTGSIFRVPANKVRVIDIVEDRMESHLNMQNCGWLVTLIDSDGQREPALGYRVDDGSEFEAEIITGRRRRWVCEHLDRDLVIAEINRDASRKEIFKQIFAENTGRQDLTYYERARSLKSVLDAGIFSEQKALATEVGIDPGALSRYLQAAEVPVDIIEALGGPYKVNGSTLEAWYKWWGSLNEKERELAEARAKSLLDKKMSQGERTKRMHAFAGMEAKQAEGPLKIVGKEGRHVRVALKEEASGAVSLRIGKHAPDELIEEIKRLIKEREVEY